MGVPMGTAWANNLQADGLQRKCAVRIPAYLSPQVLLIRPGILVNRSFVEEFSSLVIQESVSISHAERIISIPKIDLRQSSISPWSTCQFGMSDLPLMLDEFST